MTPDEIANKWKGVGVKEHPYDPSEIDQYMGVDDYECYPVFCCNQYFRPDEWDALYESSAGAFSRYGSFIEAKIGEWYFVLGHDFD